MSALKFKEIQTGNVVLAPSGLRGKMVAGAVLAKLHRPMRLVNVLTEGGDDGMWFAAHELRMCPQNRCGKALQRLRAYRRKLEDLV
jgi:hypothetical protein